MDRFPPVFLPLFLYLAFDVATDSFLDSVVLAKKGDKR